MPGPGNTGGVPGQPAAAPAAAPAAPAMPASLLPPHEMVKFSHFLHRAAHDPATRATVAALAQRLDPNGLGKQFGDVALQNQFNAFRKEMADEKLGRQVAEVRAGQARERKKLLESGRFTEAQVADIEKTMIAKGLHSYRDGTILWQAEQPPAPPPIPDSQSATWEFPTVVDRNGKAIDFKEFQKDTKKASWNAAYRVIDEFKHTTLPPQFRAA